MYVLVSSVFLFIGICVLSLLITYFFTVIQQQSGHHPEPSLNGVIMVQFSALMTAITDTIGDVVSQVTSSFFGLSANVFSNSKKFLQLAFIVIFFMEISGNTTVVLTAGDTSWRCVIQPLFQNVLLAVGQVLRVIYDALIPIYNYNYVVLSQATRGSVAIAVKCDLRSVVTTIKLIIDMWVAMFSSIFGWSGVGTMSTENNIFVNEFRITEVASKTQDIFSHQQELADCVCEGMQPILDIGFTVVRQKELPRAINHLFNTPISAVQTAFQILPMFGPKFPSMNKPLYHLNGFIFNLGKYADKVIESVATKSIKIFLDEFEFTGLPQEFVFTTSARAFMAGTNFVHTLYRTAAHIMLPLPVYITNADYMMKAMQFNEAMREADLFLLNTFNNAYWFLEIIDKFSKGMVESIKTGEELKLIGMPENVRLTCEPTDKWTDTIVCVPYLLLSSALNTAYIATNLGTELLWKSVFTQQQNVLRTLQRYDGPSYPRNKVPSCNYRATISWDMTTTQPCLCDVPDGYRPLQFTEDHPFGVPNYDPWCSQPNINANVLGNFDRIIRLLDTGGGLPGQWLIGITTIVDLSLESIRILIKTVLNLPDILTGKFFHYKINCGYGVSEKVLEKWWVDGGNEIVPCRPPVAGYMKVKKRNSYGQTCVPIHDHIRYAKCEATANFQNKASLCTTENKEGCACNIALPMDENNLCSCVFDFPDTEQEVAQTAFENVVLDKTYENSPHWCNTYHLEWFLYYTDNIAFAIDSFFEELHPAYDSQENSYCEEMSYKMFDTSILHYPREQFNERKAIYDALDISFSTKSCSLYGSHDFICSASMGIRSAVRTVTYEVREVLMVFFELLGGSTKGITVNMGNRLCDLQRTAAGVSSTVGAMFPVGLVSHGVRIGISKIVFTIIDSQIELLNALNHAIQFMLKLLTGSVFGGRSIQQPIFNFIIAEADIYINWIRGLIDGFATLFDGIHRGAGAFFRTLDKIIVIMRNLLTDAAIEMLALMFKVFGGVVEMFTSGALYSDFFNDLWRLITKFIEMLLKNAGKLLDAILNMLGPVGQFIRDMSGAICNALQGALCGLTFGNLCDLGCVGFGPASLPSISDVGDAIGGVFDSIFGRRLHSSLHTLPRLLYDELEWDGTSDCDLYIHAYKDYNFTDLRPIERVQILQCIEQRHLAIQMEKQLEMPIPHDIVYNWKRKWIMMYYLFQSGMIYSRYIINEISPKEMIAQMKRAGVDVDLYLPLWNKVRLNMKSFVTLTHIDSFIHRLFHNFDENIKTTDSAWGNIYRIYSHTANAARNIYNTTTSVDLGYEIKQATKVVMKANITWPEIPKHIKTSYENMGRVTVKASKTRNPHKLRARHIILKAAGMNTDLTPCEEQADSNVCVNCLAIDNLLNVAIDEGVRMAAYYENTFVPVVLPSFVDYFNNEENEARAKAWREDMGMLMDKAATAAVDKINEGVNNAVDSLNNFAEEQYEATKRGYKLQGRLHANATQPISVWRRARKDWEYLFKEWELRGGQKLINVFEKFLTTTDDSYVPLFGRGASWFVTYPFAGTCSMEVIYCNAPGYETTEKRLDLIEDAFLYMIYFMLAIFLLDWFTGFPILAMVSPYVIFVLPFIYVLTVYNWIYPCFPNVPNCLLDDMFAYLNDRLFPNCWCEFFPGLAETCNLENCFLCSVQTTYRSCPDNIKELNDLGVFWAPLTWVRKNYPKSLVFLYDNPPFLWLFRRIDSLDPIFQKAIYETPLSQIETDCYNLRAGDIIIMLVIGYVASTALQVSVPIAIRAMQHGLKILLQLIGLFYSMAVSVELSTVSGVGKNTYQNGL